MTRHRLYLLTKYIKTYLLGHKFDYSPLSLLVASRNLSDYNSYWIWS